MHGKIVVDAWLGGDGGGGGDGDGDEGKGRCEWICDKERENQVVSDMLSEPERDKGIMETRAHARTGWSLALGVEP